MRALTSRKLRDAMDTLGKETQLPVGRGKMYLVIDQFYKCHWGSHAIRQALGYTEKIPFDVFKLVHPQDSHAAVDMMMRLSGPDSSTSAKIRLQCQDGSYVQLRCTATEVPGKDGAAVGYAIEAMKAKAMAPIIEAHFHNAKAMVRLAHSFVSEALKSNDPQETGTLLRMAHSALKGQIAADEAFSVYILKPAPTAQAVPVSEIVGQGLDFIAAKAQKKGISVSTRVEGAWNVYADPFLARLTIQIIAHNAAKFSRRGKGKIEISAQDGGGFVRFCIADNGIGIPPERQTQLFHERVLSARGTSNEKGSGLGLAMVKDFVEERSGGKIWFESELDKGTKFYFTLPKAKE